MAVVEMVMPRLGESVMECTVINILKKIGEQVDEDDSVMEVATDKVDTEVPTPVGGIIQEILVKEGDVVPVGDVIMRIATDAEIGTAPKADELAEVVDIEKQVLAAVSAATSAPSASIATAQATAKNIVSSSNRFYSPLVLNIANTEGVTQTELDSITGTGTDNRVTKYDILAYLSQRSSGQVAVQTPKPKAQTLSVGKPAKSLNGEIEIIQMDRMRRMIADRMVESKRISPHVSSFVECDMTNIVRWRDSIKNTFKQKVGENITFTPIFVEAIAQAISEMPMINISVEEDKILKKPDINVGMAVALPSGNLIVPVIHNADQYDLISLAKKVNDLTNRARNNKLTADDLAGGTYTISNIGTFGNVMGTPIILQPQVAIMAIGAIQKKPVVIETPQGDTIGIRHMMFLSHSYDHRVVDGALGGMFVKRVAEILEGFDIDRQLW